MEDKLESKKNQEHVSENAEVSVNIKNNVVNINVRANICSSDGSQAPGVLVKMDRGATIHSLTTTTDIHQSTIVTGRQILTEDELLKCRNELRNYYKANCKIRLLPWLKRDSKNRLEMKDLFTNLYLIYEVPNAVEIPVQIQNYKDVLPGSPGAYRALIRGKAGTGKTTFLEKLALDWAEEKLSPSYNNIQLFLLLKMKNLKEDDTLIDAVFRQGLFGRDVERLKMRITKYVDSHPDKIILLLDAADEYALYGCDSHFQWIIESNSLREASVIITSRPWRAFEIIDRSPDLYSGKSYEVKGYSQLQINEYVGKFFEKTPEKATILLKEMDDSGINTGIATIPIMCMLICVVFRKLKTKIPDTISALYKILHDFLFRHHNEEKENLKLCTKEQNEVTEKLGELAFNGLLNKQLAFDEDEFPSKQILKHSRQIGFVVQSNSNILENDDLENLLSCSTEKNTYDFFHKTFQEWFAASYISNKHNITLQQICTSLLTNTVSCLDNELFLRFLCGTNISIAERIIKHLVHVFYSIEPQDVSGYNENKLVLHKTKFIQVFIELIIKCNKESESEGRFNDLLNSVFQKCSGRFTNITSITLQGIAYMLRYGGALQDCLLCTKDPNICIHKLFMEDLKIGCHNAETNSDIDNLWGEFEAIGDEYYKKCKILSTFPDYKLQTVYDKVKDILPYGIHHLSLARKLAFADLCEFMETWKGEYSNIGRVIENIHFIKITNLTLNGIDLSAHCVFLCRNLKFAKSLKKLDLGSTSLSSVHCKFIGALLESVTELHTLNLNKNKLNDITEIAKKLKFLPKIIRLDFESTDLTPRSMSLLGQNLKWVRGVQRFYIRSSLLETESVEDIVEGFKMTSDLRRLNVTLGKLPYIKVTSFVNCLKQLQNLQLLYIDGLFSPIIDEVFRLLAIDLLSTLSNLKSLRIQGKLGLSVEDAKKHVIKNSTAEIFARSLVKNLPNLLVLRLTYMWIEKDGLESIRREAGIRNETNENFRLEYYPDYDNEESAYVPQAVLNLKDQNVPNRKPTQTSEVASK